MSILNTYMQLSVVPESVQATEQKHASKWTSANKKVGSVPVVQMLYYIK